MVGPVGVGGTHPIRVQSMTTTRTQDVEATTAQAIRLIEAGCEIVRITAPTVADARAIGEVRARLRALGLSTPLAADIHFSPATALAAVEHADKVRVNPGNFADSRKFAVRDYTDSEYAAELERVAGRFTPVVLACKERGVALRIGTNHGSLSDRVMNRFGDSPEGMVESALEFVRICESHGFYDIILSMKASNPKVMIAAYRLLVASMNAEGMTYPLHLGVTEAGNGDDARIKSAVGIGSLLLDGLGDTIRVSLAEEPEAEIPVAREIAALCARPFAEGIASTPADEHEFNTPRLWSGGSAWPTAVGVPSRQTLPTERALATVNGPQPASAGVVPPIRPQPEAGSSAGALPWDPYHYQRRRTAPVMLGALTIGGGERIAVVGRMTGREPVSLPMLGTRPRKGTRPDLLVLDVEDAAAVTRAREVAWKGEGPTPRPLVARGCSLEPLLAVLPYVEAVRLVLEDGSESTTSAVHALAEAAHTQGRTLWLEGTVPPGAEAPADRTLHPASADSSLPSDLSRRLPPRPASAVVPPIRPQPEVLTQPEQALMEAAIAATEAGHTNLLLSLVAPDAPSMVEANRRLVSLLAEAALPYSIVLCAPASETPMLPSAAALGSLLCDGIGDAVEASTVPLAFDLLQGAGARLTRTDYVACPSCGRTLFDLQSTTERIKARTGHLQGVKIAIMGCVVNGPGEMADADFGYMGGSPGQVNLYVGKECVERGVPEADADERLITLIQAHGRWVEPGADHGE